MQPLLNAVRRFRAAKLFHAARNEIRPPSSTQSAVWPLSEQQISAGDFIPGEVSAEGSNQSASASSCRWREMRRQVKADGGEMTRDPQTPSDTCTSVMLLYCQLNVGVPSFSVWSSIH